MQNQSNPTNSYAWDAGDLSCWSSDSKAATPPPAAWLLGD